MRQCFTAVLLLFSCTCVRGGDATLFRYLNDDKSHLEAIFVINHPVDRVWKVLTDYEASPRFLPNTKKVTFVKQEGNSTTTRTMVHSGPFKMGYTCLINKYPETNLIKWKQIEGPFHEFFGSWKVLPMDESSTVIIYRVRMVYPLLPDTVKNSLLKDSIPKIRTKLTRYLDSRKQAPLSKAADEAAD